MDLFKGIEEYEKQLGERINNRVQMMLQLVSLNENYRANKREVLEKVNATKENYLVIEEIIKSKKVLEQINAKDKVIIKQEYEDKTLGFGSKIPNLLLAKSEVIMSSFNQNQLANVKKQYRVESEVILASDKVRGYIKDRVEFVIREAMKEAFKVTKVNYEKIVQKPVVEEKVEVKIKSELLLPKNTLKSQLKSLLNRDVRPNFSLSDFKREYKLREKKIFDKNIEDAVKRAAAIFRVDNKFVAQPNKSEGPVYSIWVDRNKINLKVVNAKIKKYKVMETETE